jgi:hypothetical protein
VAALRHIRRVPEVLGGQRYLLAPVEDESPASADDVWTETLATKQDDQPGNDE